MLTNVICCPCSQIELVAAIADKDTIAAQAAVAPHSLKSYKWMRWDVGQTVS